MSNQGNIVVKDIAGEKVMFTTSRWSGRETPQVVQLALELAYRAGVQPHRRERECLAFISKHSCIEGPIFQVGNEDTPTVIISFQYKVVNWVDHQGIVLRSLSFDDYMKLDFETDPDYNRHYVL